MGPITLNFFCTSYTSASNDRIFTVNWQNSIIDIHVLGCKCQRKKRCIEQAPGPSWSQDLCLKKLFCEETEFSGSAQSFFLSCKKFYKSCANSDIFKNQFSQSTRLSVFSSSASYKTRKYYYLMARLFSIFSYSQQWKFTEWHKFFAQVG